MFFKAILFFPFYPIIKWFKIFFFIYISFLNQPFWKKACPYEKGPSQSEYCLVQEPWICYCFTRNNVWKLDLFGLCLKKNVITIFYIIISEQSVDCSLCDLSCVTGFLLLLTFYSTLFFPASTEIMISWTEIMISWTVWTLGDMLLIEFVCFLPPIVLDNTTTQTNR